MNIHGFEVDWLGHAGVRTTWPNGEVVVIDPYQVTGQPVDAVLITHEHYDHLDPESLGSFRNDATRVIAAELAAQKIDGAQPIRSGEELEVDTLTVRAVPAYNTDKQFHPKGEGRVGFVLTDGTTTLYHAGDTDRIAEMRELGPVTIALLPVSGTYVMSAEQAAEAAADIQPGYAIPIHWGTIVGSIADAERFATLAQASTTVRLLEPATL